MPDSERILFFDGVCNLCNGTVDFLIRRDHRAKLHFASIQGKTFRDLKNQKKISAPEEDLSTVVLFENGRTFLKSDAILRSLTALGLPWNLTVIFRVVPRFLRDRIYDHVANRRYRWFGRREVCRIPTPAERERILD